MPFESDFDGLKFQYYNGEEKETFLLSDYNTKSIIELEVADSKGKIDHIIFPEEIQQDLYPVFQAFRINDKELLVQSEINNHGLSHDSIFFVINNQGRTIKILSINKGPLLKPPFSKGSIQLHHRLNSARLRGKKLYYSTYFNTDISEREAEELQIPYFCTLEYHKSSNTLKFEDINFRKPNPVDSFFADQQLKGFIEPITEDMYVVSFANKRSFYLIDSSGKIIKESVDNGAWLEEPKAINKETFPSSKADNFYSTNYNHILFNSEDSTFFRFASNKIDSSLLEIHNKIFPRSWIGVYNWDLKLIGQGSLPKWFSTYFPEPVLVGDHLWVRKKSMSPNILTLYKCEVRYNDSLEVDSIKAELHSPKIYDIKELEDLLYDYDIAGNSVVLMVPASSCPSCANSSLQYFSKRYCQDSLDLKFSFHLITNQGNYKDYLVCPLDTSKVNYVKNSEYIHYNTSAITNPTLLYWSGSTIKRMVVLNPAEINELDNIVSEFIVE